ncbi:hypothetical protein RhiirA5_367902, partial [Rhizophagus irregularis]
RLNRTIEANYTGIQTVVHFVERLYGIKLKRENLTENTGQFQFEAGLATLFDMKSIEVVSAYYCIFIFIIIKIVQKNYHLISFEDLTMEDFIFY